MCKFDNVNHLHSNDNRKKWIAVLYIFIFIYIHKTLINAHSYSFCFLSQFFFVSEQFYNKMLRKNVSLKSQRRAHSEYVQKLNYKTKKHFVNFYFCSSSTPSSPNLCLYDKINLFYTLTVVCNSIFRVNMYFLTTVF